MVNLLSKTLNTYFDTLAINGYVNDIELNKVVLFTAIEDIIYKDFLRYITVEDQSTIKNVLNCILGSICMIPIFDNYDNGGNMENAKDSIDEALNDINAKIEELANTIVVKPQYETLDNVDDIIIE